MQRCSSLLIALGLLGPARGFAAEADLQFFGDVYLSPRALDETATSASEPNVFLGAAELLRAADYNIVNFEGAATEAFVPQEKKRYLLRMPLTSGQILAAARINVATLANNHAMDFGYQGLFDSQLVLGQAGIRTVGAGRNAREATAPLLMTANKQSVCILSFSRTLPRSFWAQGDRPGTAFADHGQVKESVTACAAQGHFTIAVFHWGMESTSHPVSYQKELAAAAIDAGAHLVVGHHPHNVQDMSVYKGRPIFYSLGNFAFGSMPAQGRRQEGLAVQVRFQDDGRYKLKLVPLAVRNDHVRYKPRPAATEDEMKALSPGRPETFGCLRPKDSDGKRARHWECFFDVEAKSGEISSAKSAKPAEATAL